MRWFRLYDEIIDDPKTLRLRPELRWYYICLMAIANRQPERGTLPVLQDIAIHFRLSEAKTCAIIEELLEQGFIDERDAHQGLAIHGWSIRQRASDDVNTRVVKHRSNGHVTLQQRSRNVPRTCATETDTETDTELPPTPSRGSGAGEAGVSASPLPDPIPEPEPLADSASRAAMGMATEAAWDAPGSTGRAHRVKSIDPAPETHQEQSRAFPENPTPPAPDPSLSPEYDRVARLAAELAGDVSWSLWVSSQAKLGHPAHAIEEALTVCVNQGKWDRRLAGGVLRRLASEGYPKPQKSTKPVRASPAATATERPWEEAKYQDAAAEGLAKLKTEIEARKASHGPRINL